MNFPERLASENGLVLLRTLARLLFAALVFSYFYLDAQPETLPLSGIFLFAAYVFAHGLLLSRLLPAREWIALLIDAVAVTITVNLDPAAPPPTLVLFLITLITAGMLRGLSRYFLILVGNTALITLLILTRRSGEQPFDLATWFLLALIGICAIYLGALIYRQRLVSRQAQSATWKDPETGLISHRALVATSGWLLPLHDRMASTLSVLLITPAQPANLAKMSDQLSARLRKSDIAARFDDTTVAVLLPCTTLTAAENLITDVRETGVPFYAAVLSLTNDEHGLEDTLLSLRTALDRAYGNGTHWLVHGTGAG